MGTYSIQSIVDSVETILEDESNERWSEDQLVEYCNRGMEKICTIRPDAYTVRENVTLVAGTAQTLPVRRHRLIRPIRNMGASGTKPGTAIRFVSFDMLNDFAPDWHTVDNAKAVDDVLYDANHPLEFWVSPPATGFLIELLMAAIPDVVEINDRLPILDIYRTPLIYLMCGYAHQANRNDVDMAKGREYIGMAMMELGAQA
jgi:hypothetical protein